MPVVGLSNEATTGQGRSSEQFDIQAAGSRPILFRQIVAYPLPDSADAIPLPPPESDEAGEAGNRKSDDPD